MINVLLVGLGGMGKVHLANIAYIDNVSVVSAVGSCKQDMEVSALNGIPYYESISSALKEHPEIEVVDITTPTFLHKTHVKEALDFGRTVICEKPLALSSADAEQLFLYARQKGVALYVAQVLRYTKEYKVLKKLVEDKTYGKVLDANFTRLSAEPAWAKDGWLFDKNKSGLVPFDLHIHDLDMIFSLFGKPEDIICRKRSSDGSEYANYYHMEYVYPNFSVRAEAGWLKASNPFTATWRVLFDRALVVYDGSSIYAYPQKEGKVVFDISYPVVVSTGINVPPTGWYYEELKEIFSEIYEKTCAPIPESEIMGVLGILESL